MGESGTKVLSFDPALRVLYSAMQGLVQQIDSSSQEQERDPDTAADTEIKDEDYKVMLVKHWKSRVAGWNLKEHDLGVNAKLRAQYRKRSSSFVLACLPTTESEPLLTTSSV